MKASSSTLISYLNAFRPTSDATLCMANCYTITLAAGTAVGVAGGTTLCFTDLDMPVLLNGNLYLANSVQISGLKYKCSTGVNIDHQDITLSAWADMLIGGRPFLQALQQGLLDGAEIQRERAFFSTFNAGAPLVPIGSIILFKGRVAQIDNIGRTSAQITVASDLTLLAIDMPRNLYQANCTNVLFDATCGLSRAAHTVSGSVTASATDHVNIVWSGSSAALAQGAITFTSGSNAGVEATVKSASSTGLSVAYPLPNPPAAGDAFTVCVGCDHTMTTCDSKFGNLANFRGFPFVPPPQIMTGPLSSVTTNSGK